MSRLAAPDPARTSTFQSWPAHVWGSRCSRMSRTDDRPTNRCRRRACLTGLPPVRVEQDALDQIRGGERPARGTRRRGARRRSHRYPDGRRHSPVLTSWSVDDLRWAFGPGARGVLRTHQHAQHEPGPPLVRATPRSRPTWPWQPAARGCGSSAGATRRCADTIHWRRTSTRPRRRRPGRPVRRDAVQPPPYLAAGRLTVNDVHWSRQGDELVPIASTEFAGDTTFGYRSFQTCGPSCWRRPVPGGAPRTSSRWISPPSAPGGRTRVCRRPAAGARQPAGDRQRGPTRTTWRWVALGVQLAEPSGSPLPAPQWGRRWSGCSVASPIRGAAAARAALTRPGPRAGHGAGRGRLTRRPQARVRLAELLETARPDHRRARRAPRCWRADDPAWLVAELAADVTAALAKSDVLDRDQVGSWSAVPHQAMACRSPARVSRALVDIVATAHAVAPLRFRRREGRDHLQRTSPHVRPQDPPGRRCWVSCSPGDGSRCG